MAWCQEGQQSHSSLGKASGTHWYSAKGTGIGLLRTGVKSFSLNPNFQMVWGIGKKLVRRRQGERYHQSCVIPTLKHSETIWLWGCFSTKGVGSLTILHTNTAMNNEWYQHILREQLLPTIQEQFGDEQCLFQHDGAPCHKATKWLGEQNTDPWPGNSPDLNPIKNVWSILKRRVDKQKPTNSDILQALLMQEWAAFSQDVAQKFIDSMPDCRGLEKEGADTANIDSLHQLHVIVKSFSIP
ncbi:unnamed protein product [Oncorhynchus mykiss]|uniref:Tc1-like transposase DDE domain-containing protein n=1 Tax=Oncorhynchus mykiss TaxID=8022 RepID=A0A060XDG1_ONCMY|nr:unnamed protein product [Oncorhynchus mykiss]